MDDFLLAASGFVLAMVALGLLRILRGPTDAYGNPAFARPSAMR
jgi:hypothetical protein